MAAFDSCQLLGTCTFTFDFVTGYHPATSYIVEYLRHGRIPDWVAQQSGGFPMYMQVQSDLYYPVTWLFALLDRPYTLYAANIVMLFHIYVGALGAVYLARRLNLSFAAALFAGAAYLLSGCFYEAAQHVDIVRGYALIPWCLAAATLSKSWRFSFGDAFAKAGIFSLFVLGCYPGQLVAALNILALYIGIQYWQLHHADSRNLRKQVMVLLIIAVFAGGWLMLKYLQFALDFSTEVVRAGNYAKGPHARFEWMHFLSFVMESSHGRWPADLTLRTYYIGAPVVYLVLAYLVTGQAVKDLSRCIPWFVMIAVALVLAADIPALLLGKYGALFALSRMPLADYKAFVILPMIIVASLSLDRITQSAKLTGKRQLLFALCAIPLAAAVMVGTVAEHWHVTASAVISLISIAGIALMGLSAGRYPRVWKEAATIMVLLTIIVGWFVHIETGARRDKAVIDRGARMMGFDLMHGAPPSSRLFEPMKQRPPREDLGHKSMFTGRGFYTGEFVLKGYDASKNLIKHQFLWDGENFFQLKNYTPLVKFFALGSCVVLFKGGEQEPVSLAKAIVEAGQYDCGGGGQVTMQSYSSDKLTYKVHLRHAAEMIENEINWRGWSAKIFYDNKAQRVIYPISNQLPYRLWELPEGDYTLQVEFSPVHRDAAIFSALACFVLAIGAILVFYGLQKQRGREMQVEEPLYGAT